MNTIRRAITTERNRVLKLTSPSTIQQQHSFSTTGKTKSTIKTLKFSKTRAPEPKPPSKATTTSSLNDAVVKKPVTWPKPSEIPWQAKVVNSVNLIGRVKIPVQFEASSDGKSWAGTIVSQDDGSETSSSMTSFWIPVIFEGDLAHIAMCHLKEKDYVHVAGHLSVDVPPFKLSEVQANVQVMAHSIDFVQKSQSKKISTSGELERGTTKNSGYVAFEEENYAKLRDDSKSSPVRNFKQTRHLQSDHKQSFHASWRDLMTNSKLWVDYREKKSKGLVKPNYPDFKHNDTGAALWLNKAPVGVLQGLGQLEFFGTPNRTPSSTPSRTPSSTPSRTPSSTPNRTPSSTPNNTPKKGEKGADSWKHLIENPKKWWDNRVDKRNVKGPDFKNKDTGEALWLTNAPSWALSSLPPLAAKTVDVNLKKIWAPY